jgi:hypothetical protein
MNKNSYLVELQNTVFRNFNIPLEDALKQKIYHYINYELKAGLFNIIKSKM